MKAKFIKKIEVRGVAKDRWECPRCRNDPSKPECRFNLAQNKRGTIQPCRFCKTPLELDPYGDAE